MLWVVEQRDLWGDLGSVLISGFGRRESPEAAVLLERTGPFLPPITFPWLPIGGKPIVVSDEFRRRIESHGFSGVRFRAAVKSHIVALNWHDWDRTVFAKELPRNEPSNYVRGKKHDKHAALEMGDAWEFLPPIVPVRSERMEDAYGAFLDRFQVWANHNDFPSLFASRPDNYARLLVDEAGREWLSNEVGEWVKFCDVEVIRD